MAEAIRAFFNGMAENWDSKEVRDRKWLLDFIREYVPIEEGMKVLDLGCGTGIISSIINELSKSKVVALDVSDEMIEIAKGKHQDEMIEFYSEDFYQTDKFGFDMVLCFNAYPHFVDIVRFKKQVMKVLNSNGYFVVLHSLSREELCECHKGLSQEISRSLKSVEEEAMIYNTEFDIVEMIDNDEMFMMIVKKKERV